MTASRPGHVESGDGRRFILLGDGCEWRPNRVGEECGVCYGVRVVAGGGKEGCTSMDAAGSIVFLIASDVTLYMLFSLLS